MKNIKNIKKLFCTDFHIYNESRQDFSTGIGGSVGTFFEKSKRVPQTTTFLALKLPLKKYAG